LAALDPPCHWPEDEITSLRNLLAKPSCGDVSICEIIFKTDAYVEREARRFGEKIPQEQIRSQLFRHVPMHVIHQRNREPVGPLQSSFDFFVGDTIEYVIDDNPQYDETSDMDYVVSYPRTLFMQSTY